MLACACFSSRGAAANAGACRHRACRCVLAPLPTTLPPTLPAPPCAGPFPPAPTGFPNWLQQEGDGSRGAPGTAPAGNPCGRHCAGARQAAALPSGGCAGDAGGWVDGCLVGPSRALGGCWQVVGAVGCWRVLGQPPPWAGISASRRCRAAVPPAPCPDRHMAATLNRHHPPAGPWPLDLRQTRPPALPHCASPPCSAACGCSTQRGRAPPM